MLATIKKQFKNYNSQLDNSVINDKQSSASVLLLLHGDPSSPQIILTRRATHLYSHAGEVAFPGGKKESLDDDLLATALRETEEEIGLTPSKIKLLGTLPDDSPLIGKVRVTPFMGWVDSPFSLNANPSEIASIFHLPLHFLLDINHYQYFWLVEGKIQLPCVLYKDYKIWGFTLKVMVDMLNSTLDAQIELRYPSLKQLKTLGY